VATKLGANASEVLIGINILRTTIEQFEQFSYIRIFERLLALRTPQDFVYINKWVLSDDVTLSLGVTHPMNRGFIPPK
jgi:hypothetical protein